MQKWEICVIEGHSLSRKTMKWAAYLFTTAGRKAIAESGEFRADIYKEEFYLQKEMLIAQLALDGWEPMPVGTGSVSSGVGSISVEWCFKRPSPTPAP